MNPAPPKMCWVWLDVKLMIIGVFKRTLEFKGGAG